MKREKLKQKLIELGVRQDFYSFDGGLPNEAFCICKTPTGFEVYYNERGNKSDLKIFNSEEGACDYFLHYITSDSVVLKSLNE